MLSIERVEGEYGSYTVVPEVLSKGGVGSIHRTGDPRWVFKRYLRPDKAPDPRQLRQLVEIGREVLVRQRAEPGQTPESSVNWPVDIALGRDGSVTGVVLPAIPPALFNEFGKPRGLEFLVMARAHPPAAKGRVALLLRMAEILAFVNARGLVHGDVNGKNLAWTVLPSPVMYLIDCDGMVPQHPPPMAGVHALGWTDPRVLDGVVPAHDHYSDWYALALAMYRGLLLTPGKLDTKTNGKWQAPSQIPDALSPRIAYLLRRGLDDPLDAQRRPSPGEWANAFVEEYLPAGVFRNSSLAILDKISTPRQTFTPLPDDDWTGPGARSRTSPPRAAQTPQPSAPPPPRSQPPPPPPPRSQPPPPPPPRSQSSPPRPSPVSSAANGRLAQRALSRGPKWHILGVLACLYAPFIALPYVITGLVQLRKVSSSEPRLKSARTSLRAYGAIAAIWLLVIVISGISGA